MTESIVQKCVFRVLILSAYSECVFRVRISSNYKFAFMSMNCAETKGPDLNGAQGPHGVLNQNGTNDFPQDFPQDLSHEAHEVHEAQEPNGALGLNGTQDCTQDLSPEAQEPKGLNADAQQYKARALWTAIQRGQTGELERLFSQLHGDEASSITEQEKKHYLAVLVKNDLVSVCDTVLRLVDRSKDRPIYDPGKILEQAAANGAVEIVRHLLENVAQQLYADDFIHALWSAVRYAHHGVVKLLLHAKPEILRWGGGVNFSGRWPIAQTVAPGAYVRTIMCLLRAKVCVNDRDKKKYSAYLGRAVTFFPPPSPRVIRCLLRAKANPDTQFLFKLVKGPVLAHAAAAGHFGTVNLLIDFKADVNRGPDARDETEVIQPGAEHFAEYWMEDEEAKQRHGTPLQVATRLKQQDVVFALLSAGALPLNE